MSNVMISTMMSTFLQRRRFMVEGTVQGVGFRPFVYRLARELSLVGWVENGPEGVIIEVEGPANELLSFGVRLHSDRPVNAEIRSCRELPIHPQGEASFSIRPSRESGDRTVWISPDLAVCAECLAEVFDPCNRRFRYAFTNCTNCGPRFSILESLPYDRANSSMKQFTMCAECQHEYDDPDDRRFHAQPNACPVCGPRLELLDAVGRGLAGGDEALLGGVRVIREGGILALKGLGGYQLIVDARNAAAVAELRRRKHREEKPFAVMIDSMSGIHKECLVSAVESQWLESPQAPIVLLRRAEDPAGSATLSHLPDLSDVRPHSRGGCSVPSLTVIAENVAPGNPYLGVMLPYTPLHHLLMRELVFPVVATSGNQSDEPICIEEGEALDRLGGIADYFLTHDRPIVRQMDDSVIRLSGDVELVLRRARGFAPQPIEVSSGGSPVIAVGAHQKNTVALAMQSNLFISQHIGDLTTDAAHNAFLKAARDLPRLYEAVPMTLACDLHPDYASTQFARSHRCEVIAVQHHHAHVVSCMAEHNLTGPVLGAAWDGTGLGPDGMIWGGEFLVCTRDDFERVGYLRPFPLPGGEKAAREPRRSAIGLLFAAYGESFLERTECESCRAFSSIELSLIRSMLRSGVNCPLTTSAGRLFDAVASILNLRQQVQYEGQAAMMLEFAAEDHQDGECYPFSIQADHGTVTPSQRRAMMIDWEPMIAAILNDLGAKRSVGEIARRFHKTVVEIIVNLARIVGLEQVVLSGGCFQNRLLSEGTVERLSAESFRPYTHRRIPPNDGGIAAGQAIVAREILSRRKARETGTCA